jgi:serine protease Do
MFKRCILFLAIFFAGILCFGQAGALRDYVGLISIRYHSDAVDYMEKIKETLTKRGYSDAAKSVDNYLKGLSGSGFVYVAANGNCYILTNEHVVSQSTSLTITFEKQDGAKVVYERLKVLFVDEDKDIALLGFDNNAKPFTQGLRLSTAAVDEGIDVFAAGFPGLGNAAIWQFSRGTISNAFARIPKSRDSDEVIGPFIQHTAQIDPGNSGGPLLVAQSGVPTGYAVIGINTLSAIYRQAANYAIPVNQINDFLGRALSTQPVNDKEIITRRVDELVKGLGVNRAVYDHISKYISNDCTASNAEYAITELFEKGSRTIQREIMEIFGHNPVQGMNAAVGWLIENNMRNKSTAINVKVDSITSNDKGGFDVIFNINNENVKSEWVKEYGIWRMQTYGDNVSGNKALLEQKNMKKEQDSALRTNYIFAVSAGYAYNFVYESTFNVSLRLISPFYMGAEAFFGLGDSEYIQFGINMGYAHPIRLNSFALMPFGEGGLAIAGTKESREEDGLFGNVLTPNFKGGLMFTFAKVPGLFGRVYYHHNFIFGLLRDKKVKSNGSVGIGIGYGF